MESIRFKLVRKFHKLAIMCNAHDTYVLGRGNPNVQIVDANCPLISCPSRFVSVEHCKIFKDDKGFWKIQDLQSRNGTYLNCKKIKDDHVRELREGDEIGIGISGVEESEMDSFDKSNPAVYIFEFTAYQENDNDGLKTKIYAAENTKSKMNVPSSSRCSIASSTSGKRSKESRGGSTSSENSHTRYKSRKSVLTPPPKRRTYMLHSTSSEDDSSDGISNEFPDIIVPKRRRLTRSARRQRMQKEKQSVKKKHSKGHKTVISESPTPSPKKVQSVLQQRTKATKKGQNLECRVELVNIFQVNEVNRVDLVPSEWVQLNQSTSQRKSKITEKFTRKSFILNTSDDSDVSRQSIEDILVSDDTYASKGGSSEDQKSEFKDSCKVVGKKKKNRKKVQKHHSETNNNNEQGHYSAINSGNEEVELNYSSSGDNVTVITAVHSKDRSVIPESGTSKEVQEKYSVIILSDDDTELIESDPEIMVMEITRGNEVEILTRDDDKIKVEKMEIVEVEIKNEDPAPVVVSETESGTKVKHPKKKRGSPRKNSSQSTLTTPETPTIIRSINLTEPISSNFSFLKAVESMERQETNPQSIKKKSNKQTQDKSAKQNVCRDKGAQNSQKTTVQSCQSNSQKNLMIETYDLYDDIIYKDICKWNVDWFEERNGGDPPRLQAGGYHSSPWKIQSVRNQYSNSQEYQKVFYPLMLEELWSTVKMNWQQSKNIYVKGFEAIAAVDSWDLSNLCPLTPSSCNFRSSTHGKWVDIRCYAYINEREDIPETFNLCVLKYVRRANGGKLKERSTFAFILPNSFLWEEDTELNFKLKYWCNVTFHLPNPDKFLLANKPISIKRICCMSRALSMFKALTYMPKLPLSDLLLKVQPVKRPWCFSPTARYESLVSHCKSLKLNPRQKSIVEYVSKRVMEPEENPDIMLIHGAPGTGKTKTIVGIIMQLVMCRDFQAESPNILVCAPSDVAIDEIVSQIHEMFKSMRDEHQPLMIRIDEPGQISAVASHYTPEYIAVNQICKDNSYLAIDEAIKKKKEEIEVQNNIKTTLHDDMRRTKRDLKSYVQKIQKTIKDLNNEKLALENSRKRVITACDQEEVNRVRENTIKKARIVCCSLKCSSSSQSNLENFFQTLNSDRSFSFRKFTCCIVDEATQATEAETLAPLLFNLEKLILVGDPMLLGPIVSSEKARKHYYGRSLFQRLYDYYERQNPSPIMVLKDQYRIHQEILKWPYRNFYGVELKTKTIRKSERTVECPLPPYLFLDTIGPNAPNRLGLSRDDEIVMITEILKSIWAQVNFIKPLYSIGVILPYLGYKPQLLTALRKYSDLLNVVEINTVEKFQGREKDIIIMSCVRSDAIDFIKKNILNLALTRAMLSLFIVGKSDCLDQNKEWKSLIEDVKARKLTWSIQADKIQQAGYMAKYLRQVLESGNTSEIPEENRIRNRLAT